jgi:glycosyltransferase involved in cell wall biosynthesis
MIKIAHLVDDTTAGGVTRYLTFLRDADTHGAGIEHEVVVVPRNRLSGLPDGVAMIVSHLSVSWAGLSGLMALRARYSGVPIVHVEHSYSEAFTAINVTARSRFHRLLRTAYALFDRVVAVSEAQAAWLARNDLVRGHSLDVIPPMTDFNGLDTVAAPKGLVRHFGAIGRLDRQKGFDILIRAFRDLDDPHTTLTLFGEGKERANLEQLADGDARTRFAGFAANPSRAYASCDVVVMPSRWEPYGLVAVEANVAGRMVMMSAVDGLRDQATRGNVLVSDLSREGWRDALSSIVNSPVPSVDRLGARSLSDDTVGAWSALCESTLPISDMVNA